MKPTRKSGKLIFFMVLIIAGLFLILSGTRVQAQFTAPGLVDQIGLPSELLSTSYLPWCPWWMPWTSCPWITWCPWMPWTSCPWITWDPCPWTWCSSYTIYASDILSTVYPGPIYSYLSQNAYLSAFPSFGLAPMLMPNIQVMQYQNLYSLDSMPIAPGASPTI